MGQWTECDGEDMGKPGWGLRKNSKWWGGWERTVTPPWWHPLGFPCTLKGWNVPSKSQPPKKTSFQVVPHSTARLVSPDTVPRTSYPHFVFFSFKFSLTKICTSQSLPFLLKFRRKCSNGNSSVGRAVLWGLWSAPSSWTGVSSSKVWSTVYFPGLLSAF